MNRVGVKGEYNFNFKIFTMFDIFDVNIKNTNLITNEGMKFFLQRWYKTNYDYIIYAIGVGKSNTEVKRTDTSLGIPMQHLDDQGNPTYFYELDENDDESITLLSDEYGVKMRINATSNDIASSREIGVFAKNSNDETILLSHDVHDEYDLPSNTNLKIEYIFKLTNE